MKQLKQLPVRVAGKKIRASTGIEQMTFALHGYKREGHGFDARWSQDFFPATL